MAVTEEGLIRFTGSPMNLIVHELPYTPPEKLFSLLHTQPGFCWLDDTLGRSVSACSVIASAPFLILKAKRKTITLVSEKEEKDFTGSPFLVLRELLKKYRITKKTFWGPGCLGYLGYDAGKLIEKIPERAVDDLAIPDFWLGFYGRILVFEPERKRLALVAANVSGRRNFQGSLRESILFWKQMIEKSRALTQEAPVSQLSSLSFNMPRKTYCQA
ncbi:MAG: hypothetical protein NC823_02960, partial [Candidatus Omnitrophica bacterium]|nr:hypothetical protein [Candidatus Omnitrophota bacterium]